MMSGSDEMFSRKARDRLSGALTSAVEGSEVFDGLPDLTAGLDSPLRRIVKYVGAAARILFEVFSTYRDCAYQTTSIMSTSCDNLGISVPAARGTLPPSPLARCGGGARRSKRTIRRFTIRNIPIRSISIGLSKNNNIILTFPPPAS